MHSAFQMVLPSGKKLGAELFKFFSSCGAKPSVSSLALSAVIAMKSTSRLIPSADSAVISIGKSHRLPGQATSLGSRRVSGQLCDQIGDSHSASNFGSVAAKRPWRAHDTSPPPGGPLCGGFDRRSSVLPTDLRTITQRRLSLLEKSGLISTLHEEILVLDRTGLKRTPNEAFRVAEALRNRV